VIKDLKVYYWNLNLYFSLFRRAAFLWVACFFIFYAVCSGAEVQKYSYSQFPESKKNTTSPKDKIRALTQEAILELDEIARVFDDLRCAADDHFCWWFLFHVRIGERGPTAMTQFVRSLPLNQPGRNFVGEAHLFQYPAYWAIKGVNPNTRLKSGLTIADYVYERNWAWDFATGADKEPSWYLMGRHFYPDLPNVSAQHKDEKACLGSHYLVGLSVNKKHRKLFELELDDYYQRLLEAMKGSPEEAFRDPFKADLIAHAMETFCLSGRVDLIDRQMFMYALRYLDVFKREFKQEFNNSDVKNFVRADSEIAYATGEMLGHFRNGLRVCSKDEVNRLVL